MDKNYKWLIITGLSTVAALVWWTSTALRTTSVNEMRQIEETYAAWKAKPEDEILYRDFERALVKAPARRKAMQGEIAQVLLTLGRVDEAEQKAKESIRQLRIVAPLQAEFSEISLLIGHKQEQIALERSISLKEKILDKRSLLYGRNLIRIAFLQSQVGNPAGETSAWQEFEEAIADHKIEGLLQGLENNRISFQDYLEFSRDRRAHHHG